MGLLAHTTIQNHRRVRHKRLLLTKSLFSLFQLICMSDTRKHIRCSNVCSLRPNFIVLSLPFSSLFSPVLCDRHHLPECALDSGQGKLITCSPLRVAERQAKEQPTIGKGEREREGMQSKTKILALLTKQRKKGVYVWEKRERENRQSIIQSSVTGTKGKDLKREMAYKNMPFCRMNSGTNRTRGRRQWIKWVIRIRERVNEWKELLGHT